MQEEFHADRSVTPIQYKLLYGWSSMNVNIWLPSLSELVGTTGNPADWSGCYYSAMQGLNTSTNTYTDAQGGVQFVYFQQFNAYGGGEKIWNACNQQPSWLRSPDLNVSNRSWRTTNAEWFDVLVCSAPYTVHPAGESTYLKNAEKTREKRKIVTI